MPNPNENQEPVVNQNTNPIDPSQVMTVNGKVIDFSMANTDGDKSIGLSSRTGGAVGFTGYDETRDFDYNKYIQQLEKEVIKNDTDNLISGATKWAGSVLNSAATFLLDVGGALFDPADWRLPDVPADVDSDFRETRRGGYTNAIFKWLDNNTIFGDTEDVTGNWMTNTASDWRKYNEIYRTINSGSEYADFWLNGSANIVGSIVGTLGQGAIAKYGLQAARWGMRAAQGINAAQQAVRMGEGVSKVTHGLNTVAGAFLMTQATGMSIAQGVHDEVYKEQLYLLNPSLKVTEEEKHNEIYNKVLSEGGSVQDAEYAATMGVKEFRKEWAAKNPELHSMAIKHAGKGAEAALQMMAPAFLLNLTMSSAFAKTFIGGTKDKITRNLISRSPYKAKSILGEGLQETFEEAGVENFAENYGIGVGMGNDNAISDAWNKIWTWENLGTATLAFIGGAGTKLMFDAVGAKKHREDYKKQQEYVQRWNEIGASVGMPDVIEQLTAPIQSAQKLQQVLSQREQLLKEGKEDEAKELSKQILAIQAFDAYKSGTTKVLLDNWNQIANDNTLKPEVREAAKIAVQEITAMEKDFNEAIKYHNGSHVFTNRVNEKSLQKLRNELQTKAATKKAETEQLVAFNKGLGKLDFGYEELIQDVPEVVRNEAGIIEEVKETATPIKKEMELELTPKGYVSKIEGQTGEKQINQIKEKVKPYQEYLDLMEQLEAVEIKIADLNADYAKMTSKETQRDLRYQDMILQEYQSLEGELEELKGTDEYMKKVDEKILNHYKKRMTKKGFENFRRKAFELNNEIEKSQKEIAEKIQLEEGLKDVTKKEEGAEEQPNVIPFDKQPKLAKIELVAQKLVNGQPLTAEEEQFKNSNTMRVENKRMELEKQKQGEQSSGEEVEVEGQATVTNTKKQATGDFISTVNQPIVPEVKVDTKSPLDSIISSAGAKLTPEKRTALENELNSKNPNSGKVAALLGIKKANAQQIIDEYKSNALAQESNTDIELIDFINQIDNLISASGTNQTKITFTGKDDVTDDNDVIIKDALDAESKKKYELIKRLEGTGKYEIKFRGSTVKISDPNLDFEGNPIISKSNDPKESDTNSGESVSFEPKEISSDLPLEVREQVREKADVFISSLEEEHGELPTFERYIKEFIANSTKKDAEHSFKYLILGWELNGMPAADYWATYDKLFKDKKAVAKSFVELVERQESPEVKPEEHIKKVNLEKNSTQVPVETASGEVVFQPEMFETSNFRLGYNSTNLEPRLVKIENENGEFQYVIENYEAEGDNIIRGKKILRTDRFLPGEQMEVIILPAKDLNKIFIKDRTANGEAIKDENNKPKLTTFGEWVAKMTEGKTPEQKAEFLSSQLYYDTIPLVVKDRDGDNVAYIHDTFKLLLDWDLSKNLKERDKKIRELRALRKYIIDSHKKGLTPKIEVTNKSGGEKYGEYPDKKPRVIRSVNPNAVIAIGIVGPSFDVTHVYISEGKGKKRILTYDEFINEFQITNASKFNKELKAGLPFDIRRWDGDNHIMDPTQYQSWSDEVIDSLMNVLEVVATGDKAKRDSLANELLQKLGVGGNYTTRILENYLSLFITINGNNAVLTIENHNNIKIGKELINAKNFNEKKEELRNHLKKKSRGIKNKTDNPAKLLTSNELKFGLVTEDGKVEVSLSDNRFDYLAKTATTIFRVENIGTAEEPHFITREQPNVEFKPVAPPNRNINSYSEPKPETKEENKQLNQTVKNSLSDEQLKSILPTLEKEGWEFIGDNVDEKLEDLKATLNEGTDESTQLTKEIDERIKEKLEQKPEEVKQTQESLEGFEEFFDIFAESSSVDEVIQKLIDNKTIIKDCK